MAMAKRRFVGGDLSKILKGFGGKWVALSMKDGEIIVGGSGSTIDEAIERANERGVNDPILMRVPEESCTYIL